MAAKMLKGAPFVPGNPTAFSLGKPRQDTFEFLAEAAGSRGSRAMHSYSMCFCRPWRSCLCFSSTGVPGLAFIFFSEGSLVIGTC